VEKTRDQADKSGTETKDFFVCILQALNAACCIETKYSRVKYLTSSTRIVRPAGLKQRGKVSSTSILLRCRIELSALFIFARFFDEAERNVDRTFRNIEKTQKKSCFLSTVFFFLSRLWVSSFHDEVFAAADICFYCLSETCGQKTQFFRVFKISEAVVVTFLLFFTLLEVCNACFLIFVYHFSS
jgi:hypothetical protein